MASTMNAPAQIRNDEEERALDPAIERVRRKMMRLMMVSVAIMMIGLIAVIGAIVYKLSARGTSAAAGTLETHIQLPQGAKIVAATPNGGDILFTIDPGDGGRQQYWIYRFGEDRIVAKVSID